MMFSKVTGLRLFYLLTLSTTGIAFVPAAIAFCPLTAHDTHAVSDFKVFWQN